MIVGPDLLAMHGFGHGRIDRAGRDAIDPNADFAQFRRLLFGQMHQSGFRGAIGDPQGGGAQARD